MANVVKVGTDDLIAFLKSVGVCEFDQWEVYDFLDNVWRPFDLERAVLWWCEMPWVGELPRPYLNNRSLDDVARERAEKLPDDATLYYIEATHVFGALRRKAECDSEYDESGGEEAWKEHERVAFARRVHAVALVLLFALAVLYLLI